MTQHTSRLCKGYLTKKESDEVRHQMIWSPQSADLNRTESVWDELDRRVKEKQSTSAQHMWEFLQDCWKAFQVKLVERMPRVCKAVIKANSGYFEESKIYFWVTTRFHMCYFIVLMSSWHPNYEITHMESCSNQKGVKQIKIYFTFEILQSSHLLPWC